MKYNRLLNKRFWIRYLEQSKQIETTFTYGNIKPVDRWREYFPFSNKCVKLTYNAGSISNYDDENDVYFAILCGGKDRLISIHNSIPLAESLKSPADFVKYINFIIYNIGVMSYKIVNEEVIFTLILDICFIEKFACDIENVSFEYYSIT